MIRALSFRLSALLAAVMLLVIALEAMPAQPMPLQRDHGSAFSAATADVAIAVRRAAPAQALELVEPLDPLRPVAVFEALPIRALPPALWPAPKARGPPPRVTIGPTLAPRAPPSA